MGNELLRKDLCARLAYELKIMDVWEENILKVDYTSQTYSSKEVGLKNCIDRNERFKPILFSSLTEPITIAGDTFVPLDKIFIPDGHDMEIVFHRKDSECLDFYTRYVGSDSSEEHFTLWLDEWWNYPYWVIDKMNELHINYRLPETDFVAVTNDNNPYR